MEKLVTWKEDYTVKNKDLDSQHKELLNILNIVKVSINNKVEEKGLNIATQRLLEYTIYHFDEEVKLLRMVEYPELDEHIKEHNYFIQEVSRFKKEYDVKKPNISIELIRFLTNWLVHHILEVDKKYSEWLTDKSI